VILHHLTLEGVGPYAERQTLEFAHDERRPVTLIGGLNGSGKTTLIRSLFQILYGARSLSELGPQRSYGAFLADSIHKGRDEALLELGLTIPGLRDDARLTVRRKWRRGGRGGVEELDVFVADAYDEELSESWDETIEQIAPLGVARLFFFDGEKIEALADLESAADSLRTAVGSLLGLDLVEQLQTDLVAVQRRALRAGDAASSAELEKRQAQLSATDEIVATARQRVGELERELAEAQEAHEQVRNASRAAGGDLVAQRSELEAGAEQAGSAEAAIWEQLRELAGDPLGPLTLVPELLAGLSSTAERHERDRDKGRVISILEERDRWILKEARRLGLKPPKELTALLKSDRRERAEQAKEEAGFEPQSHLSTIDAVSGERLTDWRIEAIQVIDALDETMAKVDEIDRRISKIPNDDSVQMLLDSVDKSRRQLDDLTAERDEQRQLLSAAEGQAAKSRDRRDAELSRIADIEDGKERQQRVTSHAERAKATLGVLRTRVAERHVGRIADYTMQCLQQLLRKQRLIEAVEIDPESFAVTLRDATGNELRPGALSAGERQLTALALLWSLARAAGRPLPVVIDTPLGRLDAGHRRHVVERYLPAASHQVIVLSTDTEIDTELYELLEPSAGAQRQLVTDGEGRTEILDGYLDLAAA
jgi:DNA sulfur modification protein DndD